MHSQNSTPSNTHHDSSMVRNYDVVSPSLLESITVKAHYSKEMSLAMEDWVDGALEELESHFASSVGEPHPSNNAESEPQPKKKLDNSRYKFLNSEEMDTLSKAFVPKNILCMTKWSVSNFPLWLRLRDSVPPTYGQSSHK